LRSEVPIFEREYAALEQRYPRGRVILKFNESLKRVLDQLATDLIENTGRQIHASGVRSVDDARAHAARLAAFSPEVAAENAALKAFLASRLYAHPAIAEERDRSVVALDALFRFFLENPAQMPRNYAELTNKEPRHRVVCDYIAGMTDHFLLRQCQELLGVPAGHSS
jgi:dGTPase